MTFQRFFKWQVRLSKEFDAKFFPRFSIDGNTSFVLRAKNEIFSGRVVDIGGGKSPLFSPAEVRERGLYVIGVDIDANELSAAPAGAYNAQFVTAIERADGRGDCDVAVAQSVLEHVRDGRAAAAGISSFLREGGKVYTFCPCRRAAFAQLNLLLPESVKRKLLFTIFPEKEEKQGFPAYYDGCTPSEFRQNMRKAGVEEVELVRFFASSYFMFLFPLYLCWRLATFPLMKFFPDQFCETFMFIGTKSPR